MAGAAGRWELLCWANSLANSFQVGLSSWETVVKTNSITFLKSVKLVFP
jgi:hypothetical protein